MQGSQFQLRPPLLITVIGSPNPFTEKGVKSEMNPKVPLGTRFLWPGGTRQFELGFGASKGPHPLQNPAEQKSPVSGSCKGGKEGCTWQ